MLFAALIASTAIAVAVPSDAPAVRSAHAVHAKKRRAPVKRKRRTAASSARETRLALLALQHSMLHDFLVEAGTERPAFSDAHRSLVEPGVSVDHTTADTDFLGSPIVRARIHNDGNASVDLLLTASILDAHGKRVDASVAVERLAAGAERAVEVFCPAPLAPARVVWSATRL